MFLYKQIAKLVLGANREITKRIFTYKTKENGGLGVPDFKIVLYIPYLKLIKSAMNINAGLLKNTGGHWIKLYGDLIHKFQNLNIHWTGSSTKMIYKP